MAGFRYRAGDESKKGPWRMSPTEALADAEVWAESGTVDGLISVTKEHRDGQLTMSFYE